MDLPEQVADVLRHCKSVRFPQSREEVLSMAMGERSNGLFEVGYDVPGRGRVVEATVAKCKNGLAINYAEPYMRRRDPDCMVVGDAEPTDKTSYVDRFGKSFDSVRMETFEWLKRHDLAVFAFILGGFERETGHGCLLIAPKNAGFFVGGLADLQEMIPPDQVPENFSPRAAIYVAPPFRHTHFDGKQVVVHNRTDDVHEVFSYNLYPGPSAKKGIYGVLLSMGEDEEWVTLHGSTVQVITPYDNITTIMHEGASGAGKSEMLEQPHRQEDGRLLLGKNVLTGKKRLLTLNQACSLRPVTDDMAMCHPSMQDDSGYLQTQDAEQAWFVRLDHICQLRHGSLLGRADRAFSGAADLPESARSARGKLPDLGTYRRCARCALSQSSRDLAPAPGTGRGRRNGGSDDSEFRHPHAALHRRASFVWNHRLPAHFAARPGLAVEAGLAPRTRESKHHGNRRHDQRRSRVLLAVCQRSHGGSCESAAQTNPANAQGPLQPDTQSARRGVVGQLYAGMDLSRVPGAPGNREIPARQAHASPMRVVGVRAGFDADRRNGTSCLVPSRG